MRRTLRPKQGIFCPQMAKTDRVLRLLEALQDRPSATGPELAQELGVDVRTLRRDIVALRDLGIPVEGERGRGGSYRIKPGYRVPPLMFTSQEAAAVALGLMAAKRLGIETDGALAKVRRVLPDRLKLGVESLEQTLGFTGRIDAEPPDGETLLTLADAARRGRRVSARYTDSQGGDDDPRAHALGRRRPPGPLVRRRLRPHPRHRRARCAPTAPTTSARKAPDPGRPRASTRPTSSAARWPASPGSTASRSSCTPTTSRPSSASRPRWPRWSRPRRARSCGCEPTRSTGPPACSPERGATSRSSTRRSYGTA